MNWKQRIERKRDWVRRRADLRRWFDALRRARDIEGWRRAEARWGGVQWYDHPLFDDAIDSFRYVQQGAGLPKQVRNEQEGQ